MTNGNDWKNAAVILGEALGGTAPTPGGGAAAGVAAVMGCGLGRMAVGISLKSEKLDPAKRPELERALELLGALQQDFHRLTGEDAEAFGAFMETLSLAKDDPTRPEKMQEALVRAAEVPLATARTAGEAHRLVMQVLPLTGKTVASDMHCAAHLLKAAALCAAENVRINLGGIKDPGKAKDLETALSAALSLSEGGAGA